MTVKIGFIGVGNIIHHHLKAINEVSEFKITCVCDIDPSRAEKTASSLGCKGFTDYRFMLEEDLDVILVCLPHGLHCQAAVDCLNAGKHVMVEKPMAVSPAECNLMLEAAKKAGKHIIITDTASFLPEVVKTGEEFKKGNLGCFYTGSIINFKKYFTEDRPKWFLDYKMSGGGMFSNVGLHRMAVARGCLPGLEPHIVSASVTFTPNCEVEACTSAIVKYKGGGSMLYEEVGYYPRPQWLNAGMHFVFEEGIVSWDKGCWRFCSREGKELEERLPVVDSSYTAVYVNMLKALRGEEYAPKAYEYAMDVAVAQAAYASAARGVEIKLTDSEWRIKEEFVW